jgi:hypothetical protein
MPKTEEYQVKFLNWLSGTDFPASPDGGWVGLLSSCPDPGASEFGSAAVIAGEIAGASYDRVNVTWNAPESPDTSGSYMTNNNEVSFSNTGADPWEVSAFAVFATSAGTTAASDVIGFQPLPASEHKTVSQNDVIKFLTGQLKWREK